MSYCVSHGKDKVIFVTEEDLKAPSTITLPEDDEPKGFLLPNGEINWGCPCLGGMVIGPCSVEFRESISCFHKSTADPKGSDCLEKFRDMNSCMSKYPGLYKKDDEESENQLDNLDLDVENAQNSVSSSVEDVTSKQITQTVDATHKA